jgi:hypothetical protein
MSDFLNASDLRSGLDGVDTYLDDFFPSLPCRLLLPTNVGDYSFMVAKRLIPFFWRTISYLEPGPALSFSFNILVLVPCKRIE